MTCFSVRARKIATLARSAVAPDLKHGPITEDGPAGASGGKMWAGLMRVGACCADHRELSVFN